MSGLRVDTAALRADGDAQVLVVEDDEPLRVLFARILGQHGLDALTRADATARRHGRAPALLYVDLDSLKLTNDLHGHAAGDAAIRQLARRLSASMRGVDVVARVGGDEFIVVLDDSAPENVARVAARIQAAIAAEPVEAMGSTLPVTASIGCAAWRGGDTVEQWLGRADQALYEAKRSGRGRVHLASG